MEFDIRTSQSFEVVLTVSSDTDHDSVPFLIIIMILMIAVPTMARNIRCLKSLLVVGLMASLRDPSYHSII